MGDILRGVYNGLAPDPNSLSNLDQDLPNFIQDQVPIYSLPQEWLWCESWCSMETKKDAKTIDLCNNPQYKVSIRQSLSHVGTQVGYGEARHFGSLVQ